MKILVGTFLGFLLVFFPTIILNPVIAQNPQIDSLKQKVIEGIADTSMVSTLNALSVEILNEEDIPKALFYSKQALEMADSLGYKRGRAYALKNMGLAQYYQGEYLKVLEYWSESLRTFEVIKDSLGIANMANNLGAVYYSQGSNTKAIEYYLKSLGISEKIKDTLRIATALINIASVYADTPKDYDLALNYYNRLNPYLGPLNDPQVRTYYLMGVGEIYFKKRNFSEALRYYEEALPLAQNISDQTESLLQLGKLEFQIGDTEKALNFLEQAKKGALENNQQLQTVQALTELGKVYENTNSSKALDMYKEAETLAKEMGVKFELKDIYKGLAKVYAIQRKYNAAYEYQNLLIATKDSLFNLETDDKIRGLQFDFDLQKKEDELVTANQKVQILDQNLKISALEVKRRQYVIYGTVLGLLLVFVLAIGSYKRYRYMKKTNKIIEVERERSEKLLHNILPEETALELKENGKVAAKRFESATILFSDFKGFTSYAQNLSPEELVRSVDYYFSKFDQIMDKYELEKIKTVGDAYMCAGGLPFPTTDHPLKMVEAAFEMAQVMEDMKINPEPGIVSFDVRIGINTGPVVAGVVGLNKFAYDIWGDAVNVASRMETLSEPGRINISENTYQLIKKVYECEPRGKVLVKNKGEMEMYFVKGRKIIRHQKAQTEVNT
ncbi:adenylate/guanylate cyclase domain-containing protein [Muriicola sp.]|uniref:adenylate/guanylate cyclase domain-containing protein n=1 Tax=Muriicola sp. TaxID=2020856 RepID=UPI003C711F83